VETRHPSDPREIKSSRESWENSNGERALARGSRNRSLANRGINWTNRIVETRARLGGRFGAPDPRASRRRSQTTRSICVVRSIRIRFARASRFIPLPFAPTKALSLHRAFIPATSAHLSGEACPVARHGAYHFPATRAIVQKGMTEAQSMTAPCCPTRSGAPRGEPVRFSANKGD